LLQNYSLHLYPMTQFTEQEALDIIFNKKDLTAKDRVNKSRWLKGKLSQKVIEQILVRDGFNCIQEKLYVKQ